LNTFVSTHRRSAVPPFISPLAPAGKSSSTQTKSDDALGLAEGAAGVLVEVAALLVEASATLLVVETFSTVASPVVASPAAGCEAATVLRSGSLYLILAASSRIFCSVGPIFAFNSDSFAD